MKFAAAFAPELFYGIRNATDVAGLVQAAPGVRAAALRLLADDAGPAVVADFLAAAYDEITRCAIGRVAIRHRLPSAGWCWLAIGSEGRGEQTLVTDQDNGLIFSASDAAEAAALRQVFVPFAAEVNQVLAECGIPLCTGNIMAGNPQWCLSLGEWKQCFGNWIRTPFPEALLNASIFFDLRPLAGDFSLAETLRDYLVAAAPENGIFQRMLAANALSVATPLNMLGEVAAPDETPGAIDLKKFGGRLFVDAARVTALARGARQLNTVERLRAAGDGDAEAFVQAYLVLMRLRLQAQQSDLAAGRAPGNIAPLDTFNDFDRRLLREALRQARRCQQLLKVAYSIES